MRHLGGLFQSSLAAGALSVKEKELIVLGISLATRCEACIVVHMEKSLAAGASILKAPGFSDREPRAMRSETAAKLLGIKL